MEKKYEITNKKKVISGFTVYRIRALKDIVNDGLVFAKKGDLGGYIQDESCLSQEGDCWVGDDACVFDEGKVSEDAVVTGKARVHFKAQVSDHAHVSDEANIYDGSIVKGSSMVFGKTVVGSESEISGLSYLLGTRVYGRSKLFNTYIVDSEVIESEINLGTIGSKTRIKNSKLLNGVGTNLTLDKNADILIENSTLEADRTVITVSGKFTRILESNLSGSIEVYNSIINDTTSKTNGNHIKIKDSQIKRSEIRDGATVEGSELFNVVADNNADIIRSTLRTAERKTYAGYVENYKYENWKTEEDEAEKN